MFLTLDSLIHQKIIIFLVAHKCVSTIRAERNVFQSDYGDIVIESSDLHVETHRD